MVSKEDGCVAEFVRVLSRGVVHTRPRLLGNRCPFVAEDEPVVVSVDQIYL